MRPSGSELSISDRLSFGKDLRPVSFFRKRCDGARIESFLPFEMGSLEIPALLVLVYIGATFPGCNGSGALVVG